MAAAKSENPDDPEAGLQEVLKFIKGKGSGRGQGGRGDGRRERREPPPRDSKDLKCANCGKKGHPTSQCREPKRSFKERACFGCGEVGHRQFECPNKDKARPTQNVEDDKKGDRFFMGMVMQDDEGYTRVRERYPQPKGTSMGELIMKTFVKKKQDEVQKNMKNRFEAIKDEDEEIMQVEQAPENRGPLGSGLEWTPPADEPVPGERLITMQQLAVKGLPLNLTLLGSPRRRNPREVVRRSSC